MKIGETEIKLFYSNLAVRDLTDLCGGLTNLGNLFTDENGEPLETAERVSNIIKIIRILANANITKENCEISLGMKQGEKKEYFTDDVLEQIIDVSKLDEYLEEAFEVMGLASKFEVPDNVKLEKVDEDLEEIEAEMNPSRP